MRLAGKVWDTYLNSGQMQDVMETLAGAGIAAGGQALMTDMSPEEIAVSTGLGIGGALAMRPILARGGYMAGKRLDKSEGGKRTMEAMQQEPMMSSMLLGTPDNIKLLEKQPKNELNDMTLAMSRAKHNQNFIKPDGTERGDWEGLLGMIGRQYGDNIAQLGVAAASPMLLNSMGIEQADMQPAV